MFGTLVKKQPYSLRAMGMPARPARRLRRQRRQARLDEGRGCEKRTVVSASAGVR